MFFVKESIKLLLYLFSNSFDTETGLYFSFAVLSTDWNIGEISATFSSSGKILYEMHELKISVNLGVPTFHGNDEGNCRAAVRIDQYQCMLERFQIQPLIDYWILPIKNTPLLQDFCL